MTIITIIILILAVIGVYQIIEWVIEYDNINESKFVIEYYPLTGIHIAGNRSGYLQKNYVSGFYKLTEYKQYAEHFRTYEEAEEAINVFKEQNLNEGVIIKEVE
jgi:predicted RNase H-like HicB family nuclease